MAYGKQPEIPQLLRLLFGEAAEAAQQGASERLLQWCRAFDEWLAEMRVKRHPNMYYGSLRSWVQLAQVCRKLPWEMEAGDIEVYVAALKDQGYAPGTIHYSLGKIAVFFRWCDRQRVDPACEPGFNPTRGVKRPKLEVYARAKALSLEQARALLGQVRQDDSDLGRRDYAFFLARLRLGVKLDLLRKLRWGQLEWSSKSDESATESVDSAAKNADSATERVGSTESVDSRVWVNWGERRSKQGPLVGKEAVRLAAWEAAQRTALPPDVWEAILNYLEAANRLAGMQDDDFVFAPLAAPLRRGAIGKAIDWDASRAISQAQLKQSLKQYGRLASIPEEKLTMMALRNTAALLRLETGVGLEGLRTFLGTKANAGDTRRFLKALPGLKAPEELALDSPEPTPAIKLKRGPGPLLLGGRRTHGFYSYQQLPEAVKAMLAEQVEGIEAELAALRSLGRGLIEQMERTDNPAEAARLGQAYSQLAARLGEMVRVEAAIAKGTESSTHVAEIFELFDMVFTEDGNRPWSEIIMEGIDGEVPGGGLAGRGLAEEIAALRVVLRRTFSLAGQADEARSYAHLADIYGSGCNRMMRLLRFRFNKASLIKEAIDEIFKDAIRGILEHDRTRIALGPNTPEGLAYQASLELSEERQKALDARLKAYWKYKHGEDD